MPIPIPIRPKLTMKELHEEQTSDIFGPDWEEPFEEAYQRIQGRGHLPSEISTQKSALAEQISAILAILKRHEFFYLNGHSLECIQAHLHNAYEAAAILGEIRQRMKRDPPPHWMNLMAPPSLDLGPADQGPHPAEG